MALLDRLAGKAGAWLWVNTTMSQGRCEACCTGRRAYVKEKRAVLLTTFYHRYKDRTVRCKSPWHWRGQLAKGHKFDALPK